MQSPHDPLVRPQTRDEYTAYIDLWLSLDEDGRSALDDEVRRSRERPTADELAWHQESDEVVAERERFVAEAVAEDERRCESSPEARAERDAWRAATLAEYRAEQEAALRDRGAKRAQVATSIRAAAPRIRAHAATASPPVRRLLTGYLRDAHRRATARRPVTIGRARARGAGRPAGRHVARATSSADPGDDDGEPGPPPPRLLRHPRLGRVTAALLRLLHRIDAEVRS